MYLISLIFSLSCTDKVGSADSETSSGPANALCTQPCLAELDHDQGETACAEEIQACYDMCDALLEGTEGACSACLVSNVIGPEAWDEGDQVLCELGYIHTGEGSDCSDSCD
jgi:hypothetical protein